MWVKTMSERVIKQMSITSPQGVNILKAKEMLLGLLGPISLVLQTFQATVDLCLVRLYLNYAC